MMEYFVYHEDDYADSGGIDLKSFESGDAACRFIEDRINERGSNRKVSNYVVIYGKKINIEGFNAITKVRIKEG